MFLSPPPPQHGARVQTLTSVLFVILPPFPPLLPVDLSQYCRLNLKGEDSTFATLTKLHQLCTEKSPGFNPIG